MGVVICYSAIPPTSTFYQRLQTEKALATLVATLFHCGGEIFQFFEIEPDEVDYLEILDEVIEEYQDVFGDEFEADRWVGEFRDEMRRTRKAYPGIEHRRAMFEKSASEIEARLTQPSIKTQGKDCSEIIRKLIFGDRDFVPDLVPSGYWLGLVPRSLVQEGAKLFQGIDPDTLFTEAEDQDRWYRDQFKWWRDLYLEAAEKNEVILIAVS